VGKVLIYLIWEQILTVVDWQFHSRKYERRHNLRYYYNKSGMQTRCSGLQALKKIGGQTFSAIVSTKQCLPYIIARNMVTSEPEDYTYACG
jgi:hypothetical protein